ncbi:MAG: hypothetical protein WBK91_00155 [Alphaproteobacteria bacterium]
MSMRPLLVQAESVYKIVPNMRVSFLENATMLANRRVIFDWNKDPVRAARFTQTYRAIADGIYRKLTGAVAAAEATSESRRERKELKALFKEALTEMVQNMGENVFSPGVRRRIVLAAGGSLAREIDRCRELAQDYEAAKPTPGSPRKSLYRLDII